MSVLKPLPDSSSVDRKVGSAACANEMVKQRYLGKQTDHNVFAPELTAIDLDIQIIKEANQAYENCVLYVNSEAVIKAVMNLLLQSGQHIIQQIHDKLDVPTMNTTLIWILHHIGISGNEGIDDTAKHAGQDEALGTDLLLPMMKIARNITIT